MFHRRSFWALVLAGLLLGGGPALLIKWPPLDSPQPSPNSETSPSSNSDSMSGVNRSTPAIPVSKTEPSSHRKASISGAAHEGDSPVEAGKNFLPEVIALSDSLNSPASRADEDIGTLLNLLEIYRSVNKGNPVGLNHEIVEQLRGGNGKQFAVLPKSFPGLNGEGEVTDRWGTPYFFHSVSDKWMEIRSAGPDTKFWNEDDIFSPTIPVKAPPPASARAIMQ